MLAVCLNHPVPCLLTQVLKRLWEPALDQPVPMEGDIQDQPASPEEASSSNNQGPSPSTVELQPARTVGTPDTESEYGPLRHVPSKNGPAALYRPPAMR